MRDKITRGFAVFGFSILAAPFVAVPLLMLGALVAFSQGYVLSCLWAWYAVPLGAIALSWKTLAGGCLALQMLRSSKVATPEDKDKKTSEKVGAFVGYLIGPWFVLATGWFLR